MTDTTPGECPQCGSSAQMIGQVEANEFGPGNPPVEHRVFECSNTDCYHEFEVEAL